MRDCDLFPVHQQLRQDRQPRVGEPCGMTRSRDAIVAAARAYHAAGHPVFPVRPDKRPYGRWKDRERTIERLELVLRSFLDSGLALATGHTADVLDIEHHGLPLIAHLPIPTCPTAITGRGGRHFFFRPGALARSGPLYVGGTRMGDVKAAGGYVLVSPSISVHGPYLWVPGLALGEVELPDGPGWITELRAARKRAVPGGVTRRLHAHAREAVPPPRTPAAAGIDRSAADMKRAISILVDDGTDDDVVAALVEGGAYQDRAARGHGDAYVFDLTLPRAHEYIALRFTLCEVRRTSRGEGHIEIGFTVLDGPHAGLFLNAGAFDYPVTDRSRTRWRALCRAVGIDADERCPEVVLKDRLLRVELLGAGPIRCGRFLPPKGGARGSSAG